MSLFVIGDLHLSTLESTNKSMEVFGRRWYDYTSKIEKNWRAVVENDDTVIIPGDISWSLTLEEAESDLKLIDSLPGKKIFLKGNHDFWWATLSKINAFFEKNEMSTISILQNNAYAVEDFIICGTRGWYQDEANDKSKMDNDYEKIVSREAIRLRMSLDEAKKLKEESPDKEIIAFMHFPPYWNGFECREFIDILKEYEVKRCYFGHIHGNYTAPAYTEYEGIELILVSADYLDFVPRLILP
ncbi:MAG: metallophosphoesterase [Clostridia bacterium]|nr:metallophosphoesterase [Clostridia bacterium]